MPLDPALRDKMLIDTKPSASAFLEDIQHIKEITAKSAPSKPEIRRLSSVLRRLLVEGDVSTIAAPRTGRVMLLAPDNNPAYVAERKRPYLFFASGRANVLGGNIGTIYAFDVPLKRNAFELIVAPKVELDKYVELRIDSFLGQKVICLRSKWVTRAHVIKFVANVDSGVHSGRAKTDDEILLAQVRSSASYSRNETGIHLDLFKHGVDSEEDKFSHSPDHLDPVLVELLATADFLVKSPFIVQLEEVVKAELAGT